MSRSTLNLHLEQIAWRAYRDAKLPGDISAVRSRELQQAFMAGVTSGMKILDAIASDCKPAERAERIHAAVMNCFALAGYGTVEQLMHLDALLRASAPPRENL